MDRWSQLSMKDKSDLMSLYIRNGISSLEEIKKHYNSFATGGQMNTDGHLFGPGGPTKTYNIQPLNPITTVSDNTRVVLQPTDLFEEQFQQALQSEEEAKAQAEFERRQARRAKNEAEARAGEAERRAKTPAILREPTTAEKVASHSQIKVTTPINTGIIYDKTRAELEEQAANWGRSVGSVATMTPEMVSRNPLTAVALGGLGEMAFLSGRYPFTNFRQTLSTAGELLSPSTYTELLGASPVVGNLANTALGADIAYHSIQDLPEAAESFRLNNDLGSGLRTGLDLLGVSPLYSMGKAGVGLVGDAANFARNWRLTVPEDASRYYRIVDNRAIDDAIQSGVIRGPGATEDLANAFRQSVKSETHSPLLIKAHEYPMFAKGKPWQGSTARIDKGKPSIIRSKKDTGPIIWQESNKDFRHKGHAGIFRPSFYEDVNASPTQYFEWWEPKKIGYLRHEFPNTYPYLGEFNPRTNTVNNPLFSSFLGEGAEQAVFDNGNNVLKVHFDLGNYNLAELLENSNKIITNRNLVSEQIPIGLKGYVVDNTGRKPLFHAVYNQEKVNPVDTRLYESLIGDLNTRLAANGWLVRDKGSYINEVLDKQLIDVTPQNTGIKDGKLYIIDGDVYKK